MATDEIDLYGNIEEDYVEESFESNEGFDDNSVPMNKHDNMHSSWTTDVDVTDALKSIGVHDVIDIKFKENRQNGQSKGFCVVTFGSQNSVDIAKDRLPKLKIHDRVPVIASCNKSNYSMFDRNINDSSHHDRGNYQNYSNQGSMNNNNRYQSMSHSRSDNSHSMMQQRSNNMMNSSNMMRPQMKNNMVGTAPMTVPPPGFNPSTSITTPQVVPPSFMSATTLPPPMNGTAMNLSLMQNNPLQIPANIAAQSNIRPMVDPFGRNNVIQQEMGMKISEIEFEEILQRNKTVTSSAINRAVQDAASGDYGKATETLFTAISLVKQSKISNDDRCKILINSLSDTLSGIESGSYSSKSRSRRRRSYSGSDSGDDEYRSSRHNRRRSRSRDRHDRRDRRRHRGDDRGSSGRVEYYSGSGSAGNHGSSGMGSQGSMGMSGNGVGSMSSYRNDSHYRQ